MYAAIDAAIETKPVRSPIANHSLEPALANSAPAHLLQSFWLLSEHRACAATLSVNEISPELEAAVLVSKWDIQCRLLTKVLILFAQQKAS